MYNFIKKLIKRYKAGKVVKQMSMGLIGPDPFDERDFLASTVVRVDVDLPSQFVVPYYRRWFDDKFNSIPDVIKEEIKNQRSRGSCTNRMSVV